MSDPLEHSGVDVRRMRLADVDSVISIESETFSSPWQRETFSSLLDRPTVELLVLESAAVGVIGYAVLWCVLEQGELANVALSSSWRGRGLGRYFIGRVLDVARERGVSEIFLEVRASNERASEIYRRFGFTEVGLRRGYYDAPKEDARIMRANLQR